MIVFIGSSTEATQKKPSPVDAVAKWIKDSGHVPIRWDDVGVFPPGSIVISRLLEISSDVDAAAFVYGEDDRVWYRGDLMSQPRDNVLIELGLFSHALGNDRAIICRDGAPRVASDMHGVVFLPLNGPKSEQAFKAWLRQIDARPKASYIMDENASLSLALKARILRAGRGHKISLFEIVNWVATNRETVSWEFITPRQVMESIDGRFPKYTDDVYWWLIVYGVFRFLDNETWFDDDKSWKYSVDYAQVSERGKVFLMYLQRRFMFEGVARNRSNGKGLPKGRMQRQRGSGNRKKDTPGK
jgi:hypothetical protein